MTNGCTHGGVWTLVSIATVSIAAGCSDYSLNGEQDALPDLPEETETDRPDPELDEEVPEDLGGITGRVCNPSGGGYVTDAKVYAEYDLDGDGTMDGTVETTTNQDGEFTLTGLPPGTWTVHVEKGSFSTTFDVVVESGEVSALAYEECLDGSSAKIAVVTGNYDSVESILDRLEIDHDLYDGSGFSSQYLELLRDPALLASYDIVFFNCGFNDIWLADANEITTNLQKFVADGGSVYASDWAYYIVEESWADKIEFYGNDASLGSAYVGKNGSLSANVLDPTISAIVGSNQADLNYDLPSWVIAEATGGGTSTLLEGTPTMLQTEGGAQVPDSPLAVRFHEGEGQVIYTTFHNEQQTTLHMDLILEEIILSL